MLPASNSSDYKREGIMDPREQVAKHLCNLSCPLCKLPRFFTASTFRRHVEKFHRRIDVENLVQLSKKMCGIT